MPHSHFTGNTNPVGKAGVLSYDDLRPNICAGDRLLSCGDGRRNKAIEITGRALLILVVAIKDEKLEGVIAMTKKYWSQGFLEWCSY